MKMVKTLSSIAVMTAIAVGYVHFQVELVKLSYDINRKERVVREFVDQKQLLSYNVANLQDPSRLEKILLAQNIDVALPGRSQVMKVATRVVKKARAGTYNSMALERSGFMSGIIESFGWRAEAHARER